MIIRPYRYTANGTIEPLCRPEGRNATVFVRLGTATSCGVFVFCALAAQEQGEQAGAAEKNRTNYALSTHRPINYTYRPAKRKTFLKKIGRNDGVSGTSLLPCREKLVNIAHQEVCVNGEARSGLRRQMCGAVAKGKGRTMRKAILLLLGILFCADAFGGSVTINKWGAAVTEVVAGELKPAHFQGSDYSEGLLVGPGHDIIYDFYLPNVALRRLFVTIHGHGTYSKRDIKIGSVSGLLQEAEEENAFALDPSLFSMADTDDGRCKRLRVEFVPDTWVGPIGGEYYDLDYVAVFYEVENIDSAWLAAFQVAASAYHTLSHYRASVIQTDLWDPMAAWDSLPVFFVDAFFEAASLGMDISKDLNPGLATSLGNVSAFADYCYGLINGALWKVDQSTFWATMSTLPYGYHGPNLRSDPDHAMDEAVNAADTLMTK